MSKSVGISMTTSNWRLPSSLNDTMLKINARCKAILAAGAANDLNVVLAAEYTFRKSPALVVSHAGLTHHGSHADKGISAATFAATQKIKFAHTMYSEQEMQLMCNTMKAITKGTNILLVPGTMFWIERPPQYNESKSLLGKSKFTVSLKGVVRNTAFAFYDGQLVAHSHKGNDASELDTNERGDFEFTAGTGGETFSVNGFGVGIEICADNGTLRGGGVGNKDVHIVIGDGSGFKSDVLKIDGVGILCDTQLCKVVQKKAKSSYLGYELKKVDPNGDYWEVQV